MKAVQSEDLFAMKGVSQPVKCGSRIFFAETQARKAEDDYHTSIKSIDLEDKSCLTWGDAGSINTQFQISPDQTSLAYLSNVTESMQLYVMNLSGGAAQALTTEAEGVSSFQWAKDSQAIYYQTTTDTTTDAKDDKFSQAFRTNDFYYKADGQGLIPQDKCHVVKKVMLKDKQVSSLFESAYAFTLGYVCSDEQTLYLTADKVLDDNKIFASNIYRYDVTNEKLDALLDFDEGSYAFAAMSPDEKHLLYVGNDMSYGIVQYDQLYLYDIASQQSTALTADLDQEIGDVISGDFQQQLAGYPPQFIADDKVSFMSSYQGTTQIYTATLDGSLEKLVDKGTHIYDASYSKEDNSFVICYATPTLVGQIAYLDVSSQQLTPIYNPNENYENSHSIQEPERFWCDGADGRPIQAWYFPPVNKQAKHPAILYIHGGPQVAYGETFFYEMQVWANKGYGVINLNPRGSGSYGQMGAYAIVGDYGHKDYEDLMCGLDAVLARHPEIDKDNLFVSGGSYGGFMTNWVVGHTDRFKAAISQRSISNWISFFGTSDVGAVFVKENLQLDLSNPQQLWQMSPLAYVGDVKTPILMQHSEEDRRCPIEQGEQFYTAVKDRGVEARFIRYPESSHGLSRAGLPHLRMARFDDMSEWLEKHNG